jgi:flagellar biosynthesis GTPase FlhF
MPEQIIEIEAETTEQAREQIKSQVPDGLKILTEKIISDGKPKAIRAVAETTEAAFAEAQNKIPAGATILDKKELSTPGLTLT